ncbi:hypothetical protein MPSEU_000808900 [Mayamaea pseudoterrestris]|nr:hypothetical protein MPSEU_000808900 [Mayamaea pseudoterrestris]
MPPKAEIASEITSLLLNNNRCREDGELDRVLPGADGRPMVNDAFRHTRCNHCRTAWQRYNNLIGQHPLIVKSITAMFILGAGDLCGQGVEHLRGQTAASGGVDLPRMARFAIIGLFGAPWSHYYFYFLDHYLPPSPKPCSFRTLLKVAIDQGIQAPLLLAVMISSLSFMKGEGLPGMQQDLVSNYWSTLLANWKLWIPFSVVNIAFVKPTLRVLFVNCVFLVWTVVLSLMLNSSL